MDARTPKTPKPPKKNTRSYLQNPRTAKIMDTCIQNTQNTKHTRARTNDGLTDRQTEGRTKTHLTTPAPLGPAAAAIGERDQLPAEAERRPRRALVPLRRPPVGGAGAVHAEHLHLAVEGARADDGRDVGGPRHLVPPLGRLAVPAEHLCGLLLLLLFGCCRMLVFLGGFGGGFGGGRLGVGVRGVGG